MTSTEAVHAETPWARLVDASAGEKDPLGYRVGDGAFVLAPNCETVLARFPTKIEGERAFHAVNSYASDKALIAELEAKNAELVKALKKIAELRYVEDANDPFDDALDIADAALSRAKSRSEGGAS
jgi:hypothetical protein